MSVKSLVYERLDALSIPYERYRHEAAFHMSDCAELDLQIGATTCKNYFLTTKSRKVYCLCLVPPDARLKTADLSKQAGTPRLSFADEEAMSALLRVYPGAVSPMGLMFDSENQVRLLIDRTLLLQEKLAFHPCDNTETVVLATRDFLQVFLPAVHHGYDLVDACTPQETDAPH